MDGCETMVPQLNFESINQWRVSRHIHVTLDKVNIQTNGWPIFKCNCLLLVQAGAYDFTPTQLTATLQSHCFQIIVTNPNCLCPTWHYRSGSQPYMEDNKIIICLTFGFDHATFCVSNRRAWVHWCGNSCHYPCEQKVRDLIHHLKV